MKTTRAKQLKESYGTVHYWWNGVYNSIWRELSRLRHGEADDNKRREIETRLFEIDSLLKEFYGPKIGDAEMYEIRIGR